MKAVITIKRITEYSSIVEMDEATFERIDKELEGSRTEENKAHKELNRLINTNDWQDDEFQSLEEFKRFEE